jgi:GrpB-like predicted nucleotidyltransferase (UPF0157 family)
MIESYSKEWPEKFNREVENIKKVLGSEILEIQHIGSTAIPGLSAKPIIDIAVLVESIENISHFVEQLEKLGYSYKPEMSSGERIFFRKGDPVEYHLSVACPRHTYWERQILFRDYLRTHPKYVKEYEDLKRGIVVGMSTDELKDLSLSERYNSQKGPFIQKILELAKQ